MPDRSLTAAAARGAKEPGLYRADPTLYLHVAPGGSKQWIQRIVIKGRRWDIGLGAFPVVGLTEARDRAFENRRLVRNGGDPLAERRAAAPTFRDAKRRTFEANRAPDGGTASTRRHGFRRYPVLAELPVDTIGREEVPRS